MRLNSPLPTTKQTHSRSSTDNDPEWTHIGAIQVIITDAAWDKLTKEQQDILMEAGNTHLNSTDRFPSKLRTVLEELKAQGIKFVEVNDNNRGRKPVKILLNPNRQNMPTFTRKFLTCSDLNKI